MLEHLPMLHEPLASIPRTERGYRKEAMQATMETPECTNAAAGHRMCKPESSGSCQELGVS